MDYNFFESVKAEKKKKSSNVMGFLFVCVSIVVVGVLGLLMATTVYEYGQLKTQIMFYEAKLVDEQYLEGMEHVTAVEKELETTMLQRRFAEATSKMVDGQHTASTDTINLLSNLIPVNLYMKSLSISDRSVSISGTAAGLVTIAQYEYNLRDCELFEDIVVSAMAMQGEAANDDEDPDYSYSITMQIIGGEAGDGLDEMDGEEEGGETPADGEAAE